MHAIRDYRPSMIDYGRVITKKHGMGVVTCQDCRQYIPRERMGYGFRCQQCQAERDARLAAHTKRIRKEMVRRGREIELTTAELKSLLCS